MIQSSSKRIASSPLSSEFHKKSRLGLTAEEVNHLNQNIRFLHTDSPQYAQWNVEDVTTRALAITLYYVASKLQDTSRASILDQSWLKPELGQECIDRLSAAEKQDLAFIWIEARDNGEWERFSDHRALRPSHSSLHHMSTQLHVALLQVETPTQQSDGPRAYARPSEDQEKGAFIDNHNITFPFVYFALQPPRNLGNTHSGAMP